MHCIGPVTEWNVLGIAINATIFVYAWEDVPRHSLTNRFHSVLAAMRNGKALKKLTLDFCVEYDYDWHEIQEALSGVECKAITIQVTDYAWKAIGEANMADLAKMLSP